MDARKVLLVLMGWLLLAASLSGCPTARPVTSDEEGLVGQVYFPSYKVQANIAEVATAATVSLIDPVQNQTKATSLTDPHGRFSLLFRGADLADQLYYLEAVKGLGSNAVGKDAVRVRTLILRKNKTWTSLSSSMPGQTIVINTSTTALSLIVSLRQATNPATPSALIGSIQVGGSNDTFLEGDSGIPPAEYTEVRNLAASALEADTDPFFALEYNAGTYTLKPGTLPDTGPYITYLQPAAASVGDRVQIHGAGFSTTPSSNVVTFAPSASAVVTAAAATVLEVTVPNGAMSGEVRVVVGGLAATASFTLMPPISGGLNP